MPHQTSGCYHGNMGGDAEGGGFTDLVPNLSQQSKDVSTWTPDHVPTLTEAPQASQVWAAGLRAQL